MMLDRHTLPLGLIASLLCATAIAPPPFSMALAGTSMAASRTDIQSKPKIFSRKTKKQRRKSIAPTGLPVLVQDVRVKAYSDHTRLVLDLQRNITFTQNRQNNPDRVIIEVQNSRLGEAAKTRLTDKAFPDEVTITQPHPDSIMISLNLEKINDYKLLPLGSPDRLVVDLYSRTDGAEARPVEAPATSGLPPSPPFPTSPAPNIPSIRSAQRPARDDIKLIVVDPGHGGKDPGAVGRSGIVEKDITLQVGLRLRELLAKHLGKEVLMTRDRDVFVELGDRAKFANSTGADLFVSIHVNSHPQRATKGLEVYHFGEASDRRALEVAARENGTPIKDTGVGWQYLVADLLTTKKIQESLELAWTTKQAMVSHLDDHYDVVDHGVKTAPFYVIRFTTMPSILAEIAFISNPTEERLMRTDTFLNRMAEAIFQGIKGYVNPLQTAAR
jgi:N-acetylmuramoyl-L-alanine amidase